LVNFHRLIVQIWRTWRRLWFFWTWLDSLMMCKATSRADFLKSIKINVLSAVNLFLKN
jgi:hypothetical protein